MPKRTRARRSSSRTDEKIRRVVLCSGKVYYDLYEDREKRGIDDVYLLRVEQLYPFPLKALVKELSRFKKAEIVWCQEEPKNMGAWSFVEPYLEWVLGQVGGKSKRRALRRPAGRGGDGDRPDVEASGAVEGVPRRMLRELRPRWLFLASCAAAQTSPST